VLRVGAGIRRAMINRAKRAYTITALLRYRSGRMHGAIDVAMPIGTPLYAPMDGVVVAARDGVRNNRPGQRRWSGMPSNWVLLKVELRTNYGRMQPATIFFQHLSPGLRVRVGQRVKKGQLLGLSGNSGNSTGPHLHCGAQWVRKSRGYGAHTRYDHVTSSTLRVWPPTRYLGPHLP
jgi:murein DD-endopeptidase MepM/ murein hydrolase activator NlpD